MSPIKKKGKSSKSIEELEKLLMSFNQKHPMSPDYIHCAENIQSICQDYPDMTNTAHYYLIGKRYRMDFSKITGKGSLTELIEDYSAAYDINRSTIYAYSLYSKHLDIIRAKSECCFTHLILEDLHHNYRNIKSISNLSENELNQLNQYIEANPGHGSYQEVNQILMQITKKATATNQKKNSAHTAHEAKSQESLPIKNLPAYDPDAELSSLTFTIPSWISSIKRARKNTKINQTNTQTRSHLRNQLSELEDAITLMHLFLNEEDLDNGK